MLNVTIIGNIRVDSHYSRLAYIIGSNILFEIYADSSLIVSTPLPKPQIARPPFLRILNYFPLDS